MNVLLVDDHPLILSALQAVIQGIGDHVKVLGVASARAAREALECNGSFDLVLLDLDLGLGHASGFDLLVEFRSQYPALPVVVVSASDRASDVIRSIDLGAMGYVPKRASNEALFAALHLVMSGGIYVPPMHIGIAANAQAGSGDLHAVQRKSARLPKSPQPGLGRADATPNGCLGVAAERQSQQNDCPRAQCFGGNRQRPRGRCAALARCQYAHTSRVGRQSDESEARGFLNVAYGQWQALKMSLYVDFRCAQ
jgi:DNA-binding NarL/FixJ family response regulator